MVGVAQLLSIFPLVALVVTAVAFWCPAYAQPAVARIDWEVIDRYRLLDDPADLDFLDNRIRQLVTEEAKRDHSRPRIAQPMRGHRNRDDLSLRPAATAWSERDARFREGWAFADGWRLRLSVVPTPALSTRCAWGMDGVESTGPCSGFEPPGGVRNGQRVTASIQDASGRAPQKLGWTVQITDRLILILGDSYGSGEGYPDVAARLHHSWNASENRWDRVQIPGQWWDQRCHRSLFSGAAMATIRLAHERRRESMTVLNYACSGAEITGEVSQGGGGLLATYEGREVPMHLRHNAEYFPDKGFAVPSSADPLPAQVHAAVRDLCKGRFRVEKNTAHCEGELRVPDAVVISVGGNDLGFGAIIKEMILGSCRERCIAKNSAHRLPELANRYDLLAEALSIQLQARQVLLMEYPNPTRYDDGSFCDDRRYLRSGTPSELRTLSLKLFAIGEREYALAHDQVYIPLLAAGAAAVRRHSSRGWQRAPILRQASDKKGVCALSRWINDPNVALTRIGLLEEVRTEDGRLVGGIPTGAFHPNFYGYFNYAVRLQDHLNRILPPAPAAR